MPKILYSSQLSENASKCIRILEPLEYLHRLHGFECHPLERFLRVEGNDVQWDRDTLKGVDAVFLHIADANKYFFPALSQLLHFLHGQGIALICDTDDHYFIPTADSPFKNSLEENQPYYRRILEDAHVVTVTGSVLKEEMSRINKNVFILPNMIDPPRFSMRRKDTGRLRIGWCGGPTHFKDLALVMPALRRIQAGYDIEVVFFGLFDAGMETVIEKAQGIEEPEPSGDPYVDAFVRMAGTLKGIRYRHLPSVPYDRYPRALAGLDLDIGLCPLRDALYNRCRSAIKFYHYAAVGTVTVASRVYPYSTECSYLADNTGEDWYRKIVRLIEDDELRKDVLKEQRDYILANRTRERGIPLYREVLTRVPEIVKTK